MNDQQKIKELETLIESILLTLEYANGDTYNPQIVHQIQFYKSEVRYIIDGED
jgi:hypothetical protein